MSNGNVKNGSHDSNSLSEILLSGAFAAFTIDLLVYPLDTVKTRLQSRDYMQTYAASSAKQTIRRARPSPYALRGLYQGIGSVIAATLPASGVFFTTYESAQTVLHSLALPSSVVHAAASSIAELASCLVLTPAEVVKQNAQMLCRSADGSASAATPTMRSSSLRALCMLRGTHGGLTRRLLSGYTALAARNLPSTAIQFPLYESFRRRLGERWTAPPKAPLGNGGSGVDTADLLHIGAVNGLSAGASGALAAVVNTPMDVVKTRMMLSTSSTSSSADARVRQRTARLGALQLARLIYNEHGVHGLFRGGLMRAAWTFIGSGLYLGTYETTKAGLRARHADT